MNESIKHLIDKAKSEIARKNAEIQNKESEINSLRKDILELESLANLQEILLKHGIIETDHSKEFSSEEAIKHVAAFVAKKVQSNSAEYLKEIIRSSKEELDTKQIINKYAEKVNSTSDNVRPFVDSTLSRLVKDGVIIRDKSKEGRGSTYKLKTPA